MLLKYKTIYTALSRSLHRYNAVFRLSLQLKINSLVGELKKLEYFKVVIFYLSYHFTSPPRNFYTSDIGLEITFNNIS